MNFEELDGTTRGYMLREFEQERSGPSPFESTTLTPEGRTLYPELMREAIRRGDEVQLVSVFARDGFWHPMEVYVRNGVQRERRVNINQVSERLAISEFNTWYVRGLARRLLDEGLTQCEVYRAAPPKFEQAECAAHEGIVLQLADVYASHRARYWPPPGDPTRLSIPFNPNCHHTIRRYPPK